DIGVIDQIARHQVHSAFDALEVTAHGTRKGAQDGGLADSNVALEQDVAPCKQRDVDEANDVAMTDARAADFVFYAQCAVAPVLQLLFGKLEIHLVVANKQVRSAHVQPVHILPAAHQRV